MFASLRRFAVSLLVLATVACGGDDMPSLTTDGGFECVLASDCDDGVYCNGSERCDEGTCVGGTIPCGEGTACDESTDSCGAPCSAPDADGDGHEAIACGGDDCDDSDADVHPGATEICDDIDQDCDPSTLGITDADGDGAISDRCCNGERCGPDCDDSTLARRPSQLEICDSVDNDCDGSVDEEMNDVPWYPDTDSDLFGDGDATPTISCVPVPGSSLLGTDCDDTSSSNGPLGTEVCDGVDNDCNGLTDEGCPPTSGTMAVCASGRVADDQALWVRLVDGSCGFRTGSEDAVTILEVSWRGTVETRDGREEALSLNLAGDGTAFFLVSPEVVFLERTRRLRAIPFDADARVIVQLGSAHAYAYVSLVLRATRDFEENVQVHVVSWRWQECETHASAESATCDGINADCDDAIDEEVEALYYPDLDSDGVGAGTPTRVTCASASPPRYWVATDGDCDDFDPTRYAGAAERCDGVDNDCDSRIDEGADAACTLPGTVTSCEAGACVIAECVDTFSDCDGDASNGCESNTRSSFAHCGSCNAPCGDICSEGGCSLSNAVDVAMSDGFGAACILRASGAVACWTDGDPGAFPEAPLAFVSGAVSLTEPDNSRFPVVLGGGELAFVWHSSFTTLVSTGEAGIVQATGDLQCGCVRHSDGVVACQCESSSFAPIGLTDAVDIASSNRVVCAARSGGTVVCFSASGALRAATVHGLAGAVDVEGRNGYWCARRTDGTLACWTSTSLVAEDVDGISGATDFSVGGNSYRSLVCAVVGGAVWCSGTDSSLGIDTSMPVRVPEAGNSVARVSTVEGHLCYVNTNGTFGCMPRPGW